MTNNEDESCMFLISESRVNELLNDARFVGGEAERKFLTSYQRFITEYFKSAAFSNKVLLLLYMEVGTGKTLTSLVCGIDGLNDGRFKRVVVLSPKSVQDEFIKNVEL